MQGKMTSVRAGLAVYAGIDVCKALQLDVFCQAESSRPTARRAARLAVLKR